MLQEHHKKHHNKKQQTIVKSTNRNIWFRLVIKEIKSPSLATAVFTRIDKERFKKNVYGANVSFKFFNGANTKQLDYPLVLKLADENPDSVVIHVGSQMTLPNQTAIM